MDALANGYDEGIALDTNGMLSEASGENIFLVSDGVLYTTPVGASILNGVTRNSIIMLAKEMNIDIIEQMIPREMLYIADEVFLTGTAAEVTPVSFIDKVKIGDGVRGPVTERFQKAFFDIVSGKTDDHYGWLLFV